MKKLFIFLVLIFLVAGSSLSNAAVRLIRSNSVVNTYTGTTQVPIQNALDAAQAGDTIELDAATYAISTTLTWPNVNNLRLQGVVGSTAETVILDGQNSTRIMNIASNVNLTIEGIQFYRGKAPDGASAGLPGENGGAINKTGSGTLTILRSKFANNTAGKGANGSGGGYPAGTGGAAGNGGNGGAIYISAGNVISESSIFVSNSSGSGGAGGAGGQGPTGSSGGDTGSCCGPWWNVCESVCYNCEAGGYGGTGGTGGTGGIGGNGGNGGSVFVDTTGIYNNNSATFLSNNVGGAGSGGAPGAGGSGGAGGPACPGGGTGSQGSSGSAGSAGQNPSLTSLGTTTVLNSIFDLSSGQINSGVGVSYCRINTTDYPGNSNLNNSFSLGSDYRLPTNVAVIDSAGSYTLLSNYDYYGYPRLQGTALDIGAVEFQPLVLQSDPLLSYQSLNSAGNPVAYGQREKIILNKTSGQVSTSILINHTGTAGIPTANFETFSNSDLTVGTDVNGLAVVAVTGNMKNYLNTQNPIGQQNKYIQITIGNIPAGKAGFLYVKKDDGSYQSLIKYDVNGSASLVSGLNTEDQNRVSNIVRTGNQITFRAYRFSQYGVATIDQVRILPLNVFGNPSSTVTLSALVLDTNGEPVEGAPVTFNIISGAATFPGVHVANTNALGFAKVAANVQPTLYTKSGFTALSDGISALQSGYIATFQPFTSRIIRPATTNVIFDADTFTTTGNVDLPTQILKVFGVRVTPPTSSVAYILPSQNYYFPARLVNRGNDISLFSITLNNTVANWTVSFVQDDDNDGVHQTGEVTPVPPTVNVAKSSTYNFFLKAVSPTSGGPYVATWQFNGASLVTDGPAYTGFDTISHADTDASYATRNSAIIDAVPPTINFLKPARNSTGNAANVKIVFRVYDVQSGVSYNSIALYVSGNLIAKAAPQIVTSSITNGFWVTFNPTVNFNYGQTVAVSINASDTWTTPNTLNFYYTFDIYGNPILVLTQQIMQYRSPTANGYSGPGTDLVPGGIIVYRENLVNNGQSQAVTTNLEIKIPANTDFYNFDAQSGLSAMYWNGSSYLSSPPVDLSTIQRVKFTINTIPAGTSKNIIFRLTVK